MQKILAPFSTVVGKILKSTNLPVYFDNMKIMFPKEMTDWERGFTVTGKHEKHERKLVKKHIHKNDQVLELGACIGVVSITTNRILEDKTKQISVEPNVDMIPYLQKNKEINNAKFTIENAIVSVEKEMDFFSGESAFLSSSTKGNGKPMKIKGTTIEELEQKYFKFSALVMDIEGGELDLLRNFDLSKTGIKKIIWETHGNGILTAEELNECYDLLKKYGYRFSDNSANVEFWEKE